ncbi:MAG: MFS transporter [Deltaproteobacteria bacterium]|nr:MFS transporter [Deltaproteobacteria bacterium]
MEKRVDWLMLSNAMLCTFFVGIGYMIFIISLPTLANRLGTDLLGISWAMISYQLATISLSLVFGRAGDLYGRAKIFRHGILVFTLASLLCGLSQDVLQLISFRLVQGVGGAMCLSQARALAMEAVDEGSAGKAQALMTTAHYAGFLLGPSLGGIIIDLIHWRAIFFFLVPMGLAALWLSRSPESTPVAPIPAKEKRPDRAIDYAGAALLVAATIALLAVIDRRIMEKISWAWRNMLLSAFAGSFFGFLLRERKTPSPILHLALFRIREFTFSTLSLLLVTTTHSSTNFVVPFYLQEVLLLSPTFMGLLFASGPILTMTISPLGGHLSDKVGPKLPATAGVVLFTAASALGLSLRADSHWWVPTAILALSGLGLALFYSPNHAAMIGSVPKEHRGVATGALFMTFGLGNALGVSLGSFLMTAFFRYVTGRDAAAPTPADPRAFVAALNYTFLSVSAVALAAVMTSLLRERKVKENAARSGKPC